MAADPTLIDGSFVPRVPKSITCPGDFVKYQSACFKYGSHSSYEMATVACENAGARLVNIDSTFAKYIRDQVRTMGGNDFWIGSFVNRGRVYRKKGSTSCPIMRGQMINDALYGLVDCNSANKYICQKYGPQGDDTNSFGADSPMGGRPSLAPTTITTTEKVEEDDGGGISPAVYIVITVIVLIVALIALKIIIGRYIRDKKNRKKPTKPTATLTKDKESNAKRQVFSPKWRKDVQSKTSSVDSAVPPSNTSTTPEKPKVDYQAAAQHEKELIRMGRPRVNGPEPTRQPLEVEKDLIYRQSRADKVIYDREPATRRHRRTHSDPRSEYDLHRSRSRRRHSYYSDYSRSDSESNSDNSSYSGHRYGPKKVYQRHASRSGMRREPLHYNMDPSPYGPPQRDRRHHHGRQHGESGHRNRSHHSHVYRNDDHKDYGRYDSNKEARYGSYGKRERTYGRKESRLPTVSAKVQSQTFERQYFPEPHRLMSWNNMGELNDLTKSADQLVQDNTRSFPKEPIRVSRQIHQPARKRTTVMKPKKSSKAKDENHIYESLDEMKRNKLLKKTSERNKNRKKREKRDLQRASNSRTSGRSVISMQSRRLPSPPT